MATKKWRGGAAAVGQVTRITFSAYTTGVTYTVTINGKSISYTAIASTIGDVAGGLVTAWQSTTEPEFSEVTPSSSSGLLLTAVTLGVPFTVTASATGGVTSTITAVTAPTGPNHFDNAVNWEGGSLPSGGDDLVFEQSTYDVLYGLVSTTNFASLTFDSTFTGAVGLPTQNARGYREYRSRFLKLGDGSSAYVVTIGLGSGRQATRLLLDVFGTDAAIQIYGSGNSGADELPIVIKNTGSASTLDLFGGSVKLDADSSATFAAIRVTPGSSFQTKLVTGALVACGAVTASGGEVELQGNSTSLTASNRAIVRTVLAALCPTVTVGDGARVNWGSSEGISTKANVQTQGTLDFSGSADPKTVAACDVFPGGMLMDPLGVVTFTAAIAIKGCKIGDVTLDLGRNRNVQVS